MGSLSFKPLGRAEWPDLVKLFGPRGACAGCWCMWWRLPASEFKRLHGDGTRRALRRLAFGHEPPGILAYRDGRPIGWCAVAPRERYVRLETSKVLAPVDERTGSSGTRPPSGVWSIPCFFVARGERRTGLTSRLIGAALSYARRRGARIVEAYPVDTKKEMPALALYTGVASTFRSAGFVEAARRSETRPIMRKVLSRRTAARRS